MTDVQLLMLHSNTWNHFTVCKQWQFLILWKQISSNIKNKQKKQLTTTTTYKLFTYKSSYLCENK